MRRGLVVLVVVFAAGCSSNAKATATVAQYQAIAQPVKDAWTTFKAGVEVLPASAPREAVAALAAPLIAAMRAFDERLLGLSFSPAVEADAKTVVTANEALITDMGVGDRYSQQLQADIGKDNAAYSIIRHDLGLPPA